MKTIFAIGAQSFVDLAHLAVARRRRTRFLVSPPARTLARLAALIVAGASSAAAQQGTITTVAGGYLPNNVPAVSAQVDGPSSVSTDAFGNVYIAARGASVALKVDTAGIVTIVAGNGTVRPVGDGGLATSTALTSLWAVVPDPFGNLFISDTFASQIRRVDAVTGVITTVAGDGTEAYGGDGGPATSAQLAVPDGIALDRAGNIFIADVGNNRVRRVDAVTGVITTVAGNGTQGFGGDGGLAINANLNFSQGGVAVDRAGTLYIADTGNNRIRRVDAVTGVITTVAGNGNFAFAGDAGPAVNASLQGPFGVAVDGSGNLFIADTGNNRVRRVDAVTQLITTVAGFGPVGFGVGSLSGDGGPATSATFGNINGVAVDGAGNLFIADPHNDRIRRVDAATGIVTTIAGTQVGDGGPATGASFFSPQSVLMGTQNNLLVVDTNNQRVRSVDLGTGIIATVAGNGNDGYTGDLGPPTGAALSQPAGAAIDHLGRLVIADTTNNRIRLADQYTGTIRTIAGTGAAGFGGDGAGSAYAILNQPTGVAADGAGNLFIADNGNNRIRRIDAGTGLITTVAGNGTAAYNGDGGPAITASLNAPNTIAVDGAGNLTIADSGNNAVRHLNTATGVITTIAGNGVAGFAGDGGPATSANLNFPLGVAFDLAGNLFIADRFNRRIRMVQASTGLITTVAGNGTALFSGDGGPATSAGLLGTGVAVDKVGNLFIADPGNHRVRRVILSPAVSLLPTSLSFGTLLVGQRSTSQTLTVTNIGSAPLNVSAFGLGGDAGDFRIMMNCSAPVAPGASCTFGIVFTPTAPGPRSATLILHDDAGAGLQFVTLTGTGTRAPPILSPNPNVLTWVVPVNVWTTRTMTVTNTGSSGPAAISSVSITGSPLFTIVGNTCGSSLAQGASCQVSVQFSATRPWFSYGTLVFQDDAAGNPQRVSLLGFAYPRFPF